MNVRNSVWRIGDENKSLQTLELNIYDIIKESHAVKHNEKKGVCRNNIAFYRLGKF